MTKREQTEEKIWIGHNAWEIMADCRRYLTGLAGPIDAEDLVTRIDEWQARVTAATPGGEVVEQ